MELDLNQYYCSSNLPRLYRQRKRDGDELLAPNRRQGGYRRLRASQKTERRGRVAEATLLGAAFDAREYDKAEKLAAEVRSEPGGRTGKLTARWET